MPPAPDHIRGSQSGIWRLAEEAAAGSPSRASPRPAKATETRPAPRNPPLSPGRARRARFIENAWCPEKDSNIQTTENFMSLKLRDEFFGGGARVRMACKFPTKSGTETPN